MKSILVHVQDDNSFDYRLQTALELCRATNGHLRCLHVSSIQAYMAMDPFGGVFVMQDVLASIDDYDKKLQHRIEERLATEDVSWDYHQVTGNPVNVIVSEAALADVVVVGRDFEPENRRAPISFIGEMLGRSRTPLLVPPMDGARYYPAGAAMVAWNGSYESANAVRGAVGLLKLASNVIVVRVDPGENETLPAEELFKYLSRHGIEAQSRVVETLDGDIASALLDCADQSTATAIVMGGYSHSRIGEFVFGGVTRDLLEKSPVSLLIAH